MSYLNQCETAREYGVSPRTVRRWVKAAVIPTDARGRVKRDDVETFLAKEGGRRLSRKPRGSEWTPDVLNFVAAVMKQLRKGSVSVGALKSYPRPPQAPGPATWNTKSEDLKLLRNCGLHPVALAAASAALARVPRLVTPPRGRTVERLARSVCRKEGLPKEMLDLVLAGSAGLLEKLAAKGLLRTRNRSSHLGPGEVFARSGVDISRKQLRSVSGGDKAAAGAWLARTCGIKARPPQGVEPPVLRPALAEWVRRDPKIAGLSRNQRLAVSRATSTVVEAVRAWGETEGTGDA